MKNLVLIGITLAMTGCVLDQFVAHDNVRGRPPTLGGRHTGPECGKYQSGDPRRYGVFKTYDEERRPILAGHRAVGATPFESAVYVTCVDRGLDDYKKGDAIIADNVDFDDRHFDHLRAAAMVMDCAMSPKCEPDVLGMMAGYAKRVDAQAADAALAAANASGPFRQAFGAKLAWATRTIGERVAALDTRRRELWVGIPEQVFSERREYYQRFAALYAELDPVVAAATAGTGDAAATAAKLRALRGRYLDACKVEGCLFTPFVLETTRALALVAVRQRQVPEALAEAEILRDDRLQSQLFSRAMLAALLPATTREAERFDKYDRAKRGGADAASLRAMFGDVPPIHISADGPWVVWGKKQLVDMTASLERAGTKTAGGNVRAVQRHGDRATVLFADIVTTYDEDDCVETNKIDGIDRNGKIIYRQACRTVRTHTERTKVDPIDVPAAEATGLQPGELVGAYVGADGRGAIATVQRDGKLVQIRGHRLRVKEHHRAAE